MKNIVTFTSADECRKYIQNLWITDEFRESDWVAGIADDVASELPVFYELTNKDERSHFSTWFRAVAHRKYKNKFVQDLYYLHEFVHVAGLNYDANADWSDWYRKMAENEMEASLASEAFVYWYVPGLREKTFNHKIWADRFRFEDARKRSNDDDSMFNEDAIRIERQRIIRDPDPFDWLELQIANYMEQNKDWCRIWSKQWRKVEEHISYLDTLPDEKKGAVHKHWLESQMGSWKIPFHSECIKFAKIYRNNKKRFGNYLLE